MGCDFHGMFELNSIFSSSYGQVGAVICEEIVGVLKKPDFSLV